MPPDRPSSSDTRTVVSLASSDVTETGDSARAQIRRTPSNESLETQEKILNAAESLFLETGFAATSLRAIARRADVNLAAAHYHFGSKEGLLAAAFHRRIAPLNSIRLRSLDALEAGLDVPDVREVVGAFLEPLSSVDPQSLLPRLVGRLYSEPTTVSKPLIDDAFIEVSQRFLAALSKALPEVPLETLRWRFHFVIGSMVHLISFEKPQIPLAANMNMNHGLENLIDFAVNGLDPEHSRRRLASARPSAAFSTSQVASGSSGTDEEPKR